LFSPIDIFPSSLARPVRCGTFCYGSQVTCLVGELNKTNAYRSQVEPFKIARARKASRRFYLYFRRNGIFIRDPIKQQFAALDELLLAALNEHAMNFQHGTREFASIDKLAKEGEDMITRLEAEVQKRLWDSALKDEITIESKHD
jgi:hypothetical protein